MGQIPFSESLGNLYRAHHPQWTTARLIHTIQETAIGYLSRSEMVCTTQHRAIVSIFNVKSQENAIVLC